MKLKKYRVAVNLLGKKYNAIVIMDNKGGIEKVAVQRNIFCSYNRDGIYDPHDEVVSVNIVDLLDGRQLDKIADACLTQDMLELC